jgi:hypothetical protein
MGDQEGTARTAETRVGQMDQLVGCGPHA